MTPHSDAARDDAGQSTAETDFLDQLGQRVRRMRGLAGMSRKVLAEVSGISERYIAQLESGKGNVSIVLLRRIANAINAPLDDIIPGGEPSPDWPVIRDLLKKASASQIAEVKELLAGGSSAPLRRSFSGIALIGLRGAGKSTLGRMLAERIGWSFVELNKEIERQNGLSVAEIIALYGQEGFRRMEQAALVALLARNELMVLATGGGAFLREETRRRIQDKAVSVWLKADADVIMRRVRRRADRPLLKTADPEGTIARLLIEREPVYQLADLTIFSRDVPHDRVVEDCLGEAVKPVIANEARMFARG